MVRRAGYILHNDVVGRVADPVNRAAADAISQRLLERLLTFTAWIGWVLLLVIVIAAITAPYPWAVWIRTRVAEVFSLGGEAVTGKVREDATLKWIRAHLDILQASGAAAAILLLLIASVGWLGFLVIAGLLAVYELALWRLGRSAEPDEAAESAGG